MAPCYTTGGRWMALLLFLPPLELSGFGVSHGSFFCQSCLGMFILNHWQVVHQSSCSVGYLSGGQGWCASLCSQFWGFLAHSPVLSSNPLAVFDSTTMMGMDGALPCSLNSMLFSADKPDLQWQPGWDNPHLCWVFSLLLNQRMLYYQTGHYILTHRYVPTYSSFFFSLSFIFCCVMARRGEEWVGGGREGRERSWRGRYLFVPLPLWPGHCCWAVLYIS